MYSPKKHLTPRQSSLAPPCSQLELRANTKGQLGSFWATIAASNIYWAAVNHNALFVGLECTPLCQLLGRIWNFFWVPDTHKPTVKRWLYQNIFTTLLCYFYYNNKNRMKNRQNGHCEYQKFIVCSSFPNNVTFTWLHTRILGALVLLRSNLPSCEDRQPQKSWEKGIIVLQALSHITPMSCVQLEASGTSLDCLTLANMEVGYGFGARNTS